MYSLTDLDGKENKKLQGVNKNVVKNIIHKEFVGVLFNKNMMKHKMRRIQLNCLKLELIMFAKFICLVFLIKDTY